MSRHKPPTKSELAQWEKYGSYAGSDAVNRMIVEIREMRAGEIEISQAFDDLVATIVSLRKALVKHGHHTPNCPAYNELNVKCMCGLHNAIEG